MFESLSFKPRSGISYANLFAVSLLSVGMLFMTGCFSTTKVVTASKTVTYKGDLFNVSNVSKIGTRMEGTLSNGDVRTMKNMDKKSVEALLKDNSPMMVSSIIDMDDQHMVYERRNITSYKEFSKMQKNFESAANKISKFMANKKSTQLKLK